MLGQIFNTIVLIIVFFIGWWRGASDQNRKNKP